MSRQFVMKAGMRILLVCLPLLATAGCATTYVPVSWGFGEKVRQLSYSDQTLSTLFDRYDPRRTTLRVSGQSFEEVMMPSEVKYHLGAYRADSKLIYRNLYHDYNDYELRDLIAHEFAHHLWFSFMSAKQQEEWREYLASKPNVLQMMVRANYPRPGDWDSEDFAFTIEYARPSDIDQLATLGVITNEERDRILASLPALRHGVAPPAGHAATASRATAAPPGIPKKGTASDI